jgi:hypothetical protein
MVSHFVSVNIVDFVCGVCVYILVDLFYMKTCNYRDAQPQLLGPNKDEIEGILCQTTPVARYGMKACRGGRCFLCLPWRQQGLVKKQKIKTTVDFTDNYVHHFVNKYEAILNCEAVSDLGWMIDNTIIYKRH